MSRNVVCNDHVEIVEWPESRWIFFRLACVVYSPQALPIGQVNALRLSSTYAKRIIMLFSGVLQIHKNAHNTNCSSFKNFVL